MNDKLNVLVVDMFLTVLTILLVSLFYPGNSVNGAKSATGLMLFALTFLASLYIFDLYDLSSVNGVRTIYRLIGVYATLILYVSLWFLFFPSSGIRRSSLILAGLVLSGVTYVWRHIFVRAIHVFGSRERILVVGGPFDAGAVESVTSFCNSRYDLVGFLQLEEALAPRENGGPANGEFQENLVAAESARVGATGSFAAATAVARAPERTDPKYEAVAEPERVVNLGFATADRLRNLVVAYGLRSLVVRNDSVSPALASALSKLRFEGLRIYPLTEFYMNLTEELPLDLLSDAWLSFAEGFDVLHARLFRRAKRLMDMILAAVVLFLSLPILLAAAIAIKLDSPGPLLLRQLRVGWMGRPFNALKLRSMRADAESDGKPKWASADDPRITPVGRILRTFRIDELPQLVNVLRGEMSFVGPRPERPEFVEELTTCIPFYHLRHYVPPGVTGLAQVKYPYGASVEDARRKLQFDLCYIRNASPLLDLRIVLRTARVVLFGNGSR